MTRTVARERVSLMLSFAGNIVAMYDPSGLGRDWVLAMGSGVSAKIRDRRTDVTYTSKYVRSAFRSWFVAAAGEVFGAK